MHPHSLLFFASAWHEWNIIPGKYQVVLPDPFSISSRLPVQDLPGHGIEKEDPLIVGGHGGQGGGHNLLGRRAGGGHAPDSVCLAPVDIGADDKGAEWRISQVPRADGGQFGHGSR